MNNYDANPDPGGHKICAAISDKLNPPPPKKLRGRTRRGQWARANAQFLNGLRGAKNVRRAQNAVPLQHHRGAYFGVVKIGRLAIFSSCAVGCFFFGFLVSRLFLSLFPMPELCHGPPGLARGRSAWSLDRLDASE